MKTYLSVSLLLLCTNVCVFSQTTTRLVKSGDSWKYVASGTEPPANWTGIDTFNDAAWPSGPSPLGYSPGNADAASTTVASSNNTVYFRKTITITNLYAFQKFTLRYKRDDGIVIYVNGNEVVREALPAVPAIVTYATPASPAVANESDSITIEDTGNPLLYFRTGVNVISAEVHQAAGSTDLRFDLMLYGVSVTTPLPVLLRGPYLQKGTTDRMTVRWRTSSLARGQVHYGTASGNLNFVESEPTGTLINDHSVSLTGLSPNTHYYYAIESVGSPVQVLESGSQNFFRTAPEPGTAQKTRIWVLGDFGSGNARQDSVTAGYKAFLKNNAIDYVNLWLWLGDNAYGYGVDVQYQNRVFDKGKARYDTIMRQTPFYATPGNHDFKNGDFPSIRSNHKIHYYDVVDNFTQAATGGGIASNNPHYYSYNYNNIHFVSLDTYGYEAGANTIFPPNSPQLAWLEADLADAQAKPAINWIIVYTHYPPYSFGTKNSDDDPELIKIRERLVPILHKYKVDLALFGHSHVYERSYFMKNRHTGPENTFDFVKHTAPVANNGQASKGDGTPNNCYYFKSSADTANYLVYAVTGAGGAGPEGLDNSGKRPHNAMPVFSNLGGSIHIEVDGKRLISKYVVAGGVVKDQFTIVKDYDGFTIPPTNGSSLVATCECTDIQGYTHYTDSQGNLLLSIKKNGITKIGKVGNGTFALTLNGAQGGTVVNANAPTNYVRDNPLSENRFWRVMNRYWTLAPTAELTGSEQVSIRQYYKEADRKAISELAANSPADSLFDSFLGPYKINNDNSTYNPNPASGSHATIPKATAFDTKGAWVYDWNNGGLGSMFGWRHTKMGNGSNAAEYVVGRLTGGGGIGGYYRYLNAMGNQNITLSGGNWQYLANGAAPETNSNWKGVVNGGNFINTNWIYEDKDGKDLDVESPLGYSLNGINGEKTRIPPCTSEPCATQWRTTYFRHTVNLCRCPQYQYYMLSYRRDGGVVIYINGVEQVRENMPTGPVSFTTVPNGATSDKAYWQTYAFPNNGSVLKEGDNIIAVEVHRTDQSDALYWDMELIRSPDVLTSSNRLAADQQSTVLALPNVEDPIVLYPNPADKGKVFFKPSLNFETLLLTDVQGRERIQILKAGVISELNIANLPAGTYFLRSQKGDSISRYKLVIP